MMLQVDVAISHVLVQRMTRHAATLLHGCDAYDKYCTLLQAI